MYRMPREYWTDRLERMWAAGLNAIQTWVFYFISLMSNYNVNDVDHTYTLKESLASSFLVVIHNLFTRWTVSSLCRYVFWDQHEPVEGVYNFEYNNDLVAFIQLAQKIGFVVILRVGPWANFVNGFQLFRITIFMSIDMVVVNMNLVDYLGGFYVISILSNFDRWIRVKFIHFAIESHM